MATSAELPIGSELLAYRIEGVLGRGGMGVVYLAEDVRLRRRVALKLLSPQLAEDEHFRERLLEESELAASLDHPNIVPIYEAGEVDGQIFISMRYVEGEDLKRRLRDGPLEPALAVAFVSQIANALDAAHARGLVHRDVKPSNVLIAPEAGHEGGDHVYLADFGLTRRLSEQDLEAEEGQLMGTLDYVAPEQIRGEAVDGRADVYSLGCLLYECLTGEPPFRQRSDIALLYAHLEEEPPSPTALLPTLPVAIDAVIRTALAKDRDDRYESARALVESARDALELSVLKRRRRPLAASAIAAALIAAALLAYLLTRGTPAPAPPVGVDSLVRIDPVSNKVTAARAVGHEARAVAVGAGSVWVANYGDGTVSRIDAKTGRLLTTTNVQGTPAGVALTGSSVLVADEPPHRAIVVLDATTGAFFSSTALPGQGYDPPLVASGPAGGWFADLDSQSVADAKPLLTNRAYIPVHIPQGFANVFSRYVGWSGLAVGSGAVWLAGDALDRVVWRIDPSVGRVVSQVHLPFVPRSIAAGDGSVWVSSVLDDTVSRIDPATERITATIHVGRGADKIVVDDGSVWVTNEIDGTVSQIDARTNRVVGTVRVGERPRAIAVDASGVWVTVGRQ